MSDVAGKIGIIYGMEDSFPSAVVDRINELLEIRKIPGLSAETLVTSGVRMGSPSGYRVIIDRISHYVPFYRSLLKNAALTGTDVINNPFWWSADEKFVHCGIAWKLGLAVPRTVLLPHKAHPTGTTSKSMRNLEYPLNWDAIFGYVGFPAWLKPHDGTAWRGVLKVDSPEDFFRAYDESEKLCMMLQQDINFDEYFRCYVVNREKVHVIRYDPRQPYQFRFVAGNPAARAELHQRMVRDAVTLCRSVGFDINTVDFAIQNGIPYVIDFLNPAPDAGVEVVGPENFEWIVNAIAEMAVNRASKADGYGKAEPKQWSEVLYAGELCPR